MSGRWFCVGIAVAILGGCGSIRTGEDFDPAVDFSDYSTYSWLNDPALLSVNPQMIAADTEPMLKAATRSALGQRGLRFLAERDDADLLISFTLGDREQLYVGQATYRPGTGWNEAGFGAGERDVTDYRRGRLAVDVFDRASKRPVWHGWASKDLTLADQANVERTVRQVVEKIFAGFPPG